ncbi:hypothetical protein AB0H58_25310 [Nocardia neocaledoniensis]
MEIEPMSHIELEQVLERLGEPYELVAAADRVVDQYPSPVPHSAA